MKAKLFDKSGKEKGSVDLPKCFGVRVRKDILLKVFEAQKGIYAQAYGAMEGAGAQYSASGISIKARHKWKGAYGKGISRIPRKIMSRHGSSFNWVGATVSSTRGGRRPHAPRSTKNPFLKINKKELRIAYASAFAGSIANPRGVGVRGVGVSGIVFESGVLGLKSKDFFGVLKNVFGKLDGVLKVKRIRAGIGKMRGRKYKSNAGVLFVIGSEEKMARKGIEVVRVSDLTIRDLTLNGVVGRKVCYSEKAVEEIGLKFAGENSSRINTDMHGLKKKVGGKK